MSVTGPGHWSVAGRGAHSGPAAVAGRSEDVRDRPTVSALVAAPGGLSERFAGALAARGVSHPVAIFFVLLVGGIAVISAISIVLGVIVLHVLIGGLGFGGPDNGFVRILAHHRTAMLTSLSLVGSDVGGVPVLPILAAVIGLGFAIARRWRVAAFAVFVLFAESATRIGSTGAPPTSEPTKDSEVSGALRWCARVVMKPLSGPPNPRPPINT